MFKRLGILVVVSIAVFVFAGMASAEVVDVISPDGGESLVAGKVYLVSIGINYGAIPSNVRLGKYKLFYSCKGSDYIDESGKRIWKLITIRPCGLFTCPSDYRWEVSNVQVSPDKPVRECKVKVQLLDMSGIGLGSDKSDDWFVIQSYGGVPVECPPYPAEYCSQ